MPAPNVECLSSILPKKSRALNVFITSSNFIQVQ